jgi:hypothetical protein
MFLDDGPIGDSIGREVGELQNRHLADVVTLCRRHLAQRTSGWNDTCWYSLTDMGRAVLALVWSPHTPH